MTVKELAAKLAGYPPHKRINCLEVESEGCFSSQIVVYDIVNIHMDLTGVHLIVEKKG